MCRSRMSCFSKSTPVAVVFLARFAVMIAVAFVFPKRPVKNRIQNIAPTDKYPQLVIPAKTGIQKNTACPG